MRRESRVRKRMVSCQRGWGRIWGRRIPAEHKLLWGVLKHGGRQHPSSTHGTAIKLTADSTYSYTDCNFGVSASCSRTLGHTASDWNQPPLPITELQTPGKKKTTKHGRSTGFIDCVDGHWRNSAAFVEIYSDSEDIFNKPHTQNHKTDVYTRNTTENKCCSHLVFFCSVGFHRTPK